MKKTEEKPIYPDVKVGDVWKVKPSMIKPMSNERVVKVVKCDHASMSVMEVPHSSIQVKMHFVDVIFLEKIPQE